VRLFFDPCNATWYYKGNKGNLAIVRVGKTGFFGGFWGFSKKWGEVGGG